MEVFPTAFLPGVEYITRLTNAVNPVIDLGEHYIKQTFRNRCHILTSNGVHPVIIPMRKGDSRKVGDMRISYTEDWQTKALRSIRSSYENAPYFEHYQPEFEEIFMRKTDLLHRYNHELLTWLLRELQSDLQPVYSDTYVEVPMENDHRSRDFLDVKETPEYKQVFSYKMEFAGGLSALDLLFNKGPEAPMYLQ